MIKVIKHGTADTTKRFDCPSCHCIFTADEDDYRTVVHDFPYDYITYECYCPECGDKAIIQKNIVKLEKIYD